MSPSDFWLMRQATALLASRWAAQTQNASWRISGCQLSHARSFSKGGGGSEEGKAPSLKSQLRLLYKLIHPDLLHSRPLERAVNEKSFQVLQEYLAAAQSGSADCGTPRMFSFCFYIKRAQGTPDAIDKIEVALPSPQRSMSPAGELPLSTRRALGKLFEACGLSEEISGGLQGEERVRLSELFQRASEIQRAEDAWIGPAERHVIVVRNALRMGRGVVASFRPPLSESAINQQIAALERLANALDRVPELNIAGCSLVIGEGYGVDALGNVWLDYQDEPETWAHRLPEMNVEQARSRIKAARSRRGHEFMAARSLEIEMVYTDNATGVTEEYAEFLERILAGAAEKGAVASGRFLELPVRVVPRNNNRRMPRSFGDRNRGEQGVDEEEGMHNRANQANTLWTIDQSMGFVTVPVTASLDEIYDFLQRHGDEALVHRRRYKEEEKRLQTMMTHVRSKLRLRHLACDDKISNDQFLSACSRMLRYAPQLQILMEGLSVCISDEHRLPLAESKPILHIRWNFSIAEL